MLAVLNLGTPQPILTTPHLAHPLPHINRERIYLICGERVLKLED